MKNKPAKTLRVVSRCIVCVCLADMLLVLLSWLVSSAFPDSSVRSLLGSEGLRWLFGSLSSNLCTTSLVWLLHAGIAYGIAARSGIAGAIWRHGRGGKLNYRERLAFALAAGEVLSVVLMMALLTCVPHAILLSVSGDLFPSSFSRSLVPVLCLTLAAAGTTYGIITGGIRSADDWFSAMSYGLRRVSPVVIVYMFCVQFMHMAYFVFFM